MSPPATIVRDKYTKSTKPTITENIRKTTEEIALLDLRSRISDLIGNIEYGDPKLNEDLYLLVWLKHTNFKVSRAEKGIRDSVQWRRDNNVDALINLDLDKELSKDFLIYLDSVTKDGVPIMFVSIGDVDKFEKARILRHCNQVFIKFEKFVLDCNTKRYRELCDREGKHIPIRGDMVVGGLAIIECKTFSLTDLRSPRVLQMCFGASQAAMNYFPGLASTAYFINMNKFFDVCFKFLKPILSVSTMKLETFDSNENNWKFHLLSVIDAEELPVECGGNKIHS